MTQFSLFGAEASTPTLADLDGLLLAGGRWVVGKPGGMAGIPEGARLSVVVAERWRAEALAAAFADRGVAPPGDEGIVVAETGFAVRTGFRSELLSAATRWRRGANEGLPADFRLPAGGLRLWAIAAGRRDDAGYLLATSQPDDPIHRAAGAQLARLGVAAVSLGPRGGPGWRVTSGRRLRRLVELLGAPPPGGAGHWPDAGTGAG